MGGEAQQRKSQYVQFALTLAVLIGRPGPHNEAIASLGRMPETERSDILILSEDGPAQAGSPGAITRRSVPVGGAR
jgi:hypothetical protein